MENKCCFYGFKYQEMKDGPCNSDYTVIVSSGKIRLKSCEEHVRWCVGQIAYKLGDLGDIIIEKVNGDNLAKIAGKQDRSRSNFRLGSDRKW